MSLSVEGLAVGGKNGAKPLRLLMVALAIAGVSGYLITWLVPRTIGFAAYPPFAAFWAYLFLLVSALSGIQQEIARATSPVVASDRKGWSLIPLAGFLAFSVALLLTVSAPVWQARAFSVGGWALVWPLVVGAVGYVCEALVFGTLYGLRAWKPLVGIITLEAIIRLGSVVAVLSLSASVVALAWAVALPFPLVLLFMARAIRRAFATGIRLDVGTRRLMWNFARTIIAAASMGVLVSGLPLVIAMTSPDEPSVSLGRMIGAATLTRAPIVVVGVALQGYLIVWFKESGTRMLSRVSRLSAGVLGVAALLTALAFFLGPTVFEWLFPREEAPSGGLLGALVASSAIVGILCITGPAVLASKRHFAYSLGWVLAAIATVGIMATSASFEVRILVALFIAPAVGTATHLAALVNDHRGSRAP